MYGEKRYVYIIAFAFSCCLEVTSCLLEELHVKSEKQASLRDALHTCLPKLYSSEPLWLLRRALAAPVSMCPCHGFSRQRLQYTYRR